MNNFFQLCFSLLLFQRGKTCKVKLFMFKSKKGGPTRYYRVRHIYWAIDEHKYWTMGWPVEKTTVINRARVDAPEPWKEV